MEALDPAKLEARFAAHAEKHRRWRETIIENLVDEVRYNAAAKERGSLALAELPPEERDLYKRFPPLIGRKESGTEGITEDLPSEAVERVEKEAANFQQKLDRLEIEDLERLQREWSQRDQERRLANEFMDSASADDIQYWARMPYWTAEEATALLLGKNPEWANIDIANSVTVIPDSKNYQELLLTISRAQEIGNLPERIRPADVLSWARRIGIDCIETLEAAVPAFEIPENTHPNLADYVGQAVEQAASAESQTGAGQGAEPKEVKTDLDVAAKVADEMPGGVLRPAVRMILREEYGLERPNGVQKTTAFEVVKAKMKQCHMDSCGYKTFSRAWDDLYPRPKKVKNEKKGLIRRCREMPRFGYWTIISRMH